MQSFLFYFFSSVALASALSVILAPKPTRALLSLIAAMFALAVLFLLLGAYFVAMAHLIVYAGAVLVLFLFVIMFEGIGAQDTPLAKRFGKGYLFLASFVAMAFLGIVITLVIRLALPAASGIDGAVERIGRVLFRYYLLPFELTSLLLLLGVFAAVALAKRENA